jgi:hypothetical protein
MPSGCSRGAPRPSTFPDPLLIDKIRDVTGLCLAPLEHAAVFAVDEKPQTARHRAVDFRDFLGDIDR